jgi:hypothetical protein
MESSSQREELRSWPPSVKENLILIYFKSKTVTTSTFRRCCSLIFGTKKKQINLKFNIVTKKSLCEYRLFVMFFTVRGVEKKEN